MKLLLFIFVLFAGMLGLHGQGSYEGRSISKIDVNIFGPPTVGKSYIKQNLQVEEGGIYKSVCDGIFGESKRGGAPEPEPSEGEEASLLQQQEKGVEVEMKQM